MSIESAFVGGPALEWKKSSHSSNEHGSDCVEVAVIPDAVRVRDSKQREGAQLAFDAHAWQGFVAYVGAQST